MPGIEYTPSVVAFLDVLGWSEFVEQSVHDDDLLNSMVVSIGEVNRALGFPGGPPPYDSGWPVIGQFSDSIVISLRLTGPTGPAQQDAFTVALNAICKRMLDNGFLLRGGVTEGLMYHRGTIALGPALTRAAYLEKVAEFPRVLIDEGDRAPSVRIPTHQFQDGRPFFNVLSWPRDERMPRRPDDDESQANYLRHVRPILLSDLTAFRNGDEKARRIYRKHEWFRGYFNEIAGRFDIEPVPL